jgi:hypothetical protein
MWNVFPPVHPFACLSSSQSIYQASLPAVFTSPPFHQTLPDLSYGYGELEPSISGICFHGLGEVHFHLVAFCSRRRQMFRQQLLTYSASFFKFQSGTIMEIHHSKHHKTYVTNFNAAMEQYANAEAKGDYAAMIALQVFSYSVHST